MARIENLEHQEIRELKQVAINTLNFSVRKKTIDTLSTYGEKAIPAITEIIESTLAEDVKIHGLEAIKKIKERLE